jgi:hypothetical protein
MAQQLALFQDDEPEPPKKWRIPALSGEKYPDIIFDFERDGDRMRLVPDPNRKPPPWLALGIDDPDWMPETRMG